MEYRCISADCHIDLCWMPYDLFTANASPAMKDQMPYVVPGPNGPKWVSKSGLDFGYANGKGGSGAFAQGVKYVPGRHRMDRMAAVGLFSDGIEGKFHPTTPDLRLQDQERDGIQAEVIYGLHGTGAQVKDREIAVEIYRIYNDWLADFCRHDRKRFIGLATIPSHDVEVAVGETQRIAKLGLGGLDFAASWGMTPLWNPYWDPFWKAATDANLPVHFHTIGPPPVAPIPQDLPNDIKQAAQATKVAGGTLHVAPILASIIHGGALERFPNLRVVFGESGIGWIPYVLDRMDHEYKTRFSGHIPLKMIPSEYWRRQCRATFQFDRIGIQHLDYIGDETVMWASDYPHGDGTFPDSQEHIQKEFGHLPDKVRRKIICENAGQFYGLLS